MTERGITISFIGTALVIFLMAVVPAIWGISDGLNRIAVGIEDYNRIVSGWTLDGVGMESMPMEGGN